MREQRSRRRFLAVAATGVTGAVAGCLGGGSPDTDGETVDELPTPVQGDPDADVTVAAYEDFSCPHCRTYQLSVYPSVKEEFVDTERIRYEHHDFAIPVDEDWSYQIPSAARAVQDTEGDDAFFEFAQSIFSYQGEYSFDVVEQVGNDVGADGGVVSDAAESLTYLPVVEADSEAGQELGINSTPTLTVNGELVTPQQDESFYQQIASAIEAAE